jgi:hypothetical protein
MAIAAITPQEKARQKKRDAEIRNEQTTPCLL